MLIVVDDLDRCSPENVLIVLEAINFLVSSGDCYVVIGMDIERVERSVGLGFKGVAEEMVDKESENKSQNNDKSRQIRAEYAHQYMEKLINIEVPIPTPEASQSCKLMSDKKTGDQYSPDFLQRIKPVMDYLKTLAPLLVILATLVVGIWIEPRLETFLERKPQAGERAQPDVAFEERGKPTAPINDKEKQAEKDTKKEAAVFIEGQKADLPRSHFIIPLIIFTALGIFIVLRRPDIIVKDSPEFVTALRVWHPLVITVNHTPRSVKRFMNRVRYFAMRQKKQSEEETLLKQLIFRFIFKRHDKLTNRDGLPVIEELPESILVALSAIHHLNPEWIDNESIFTKKTENITSDHLSDVSDDIAHTLKETISEHIKTLHHWPPTQKQRLLFKKMSAHIRVH
jgi:hypothetical protein